MSYHLNIKYQAVNRKENEFPESLTFPPDNSGTSLVRYNKKVANSGLGTDGILSHKGSHKKSYFFSGFFCEIFIRASKKALFT